VTMSHQTLLGEMGLELEDFGGHGIVLRTIPDIWDGLDATSLMESFIDTLVERNHVADVSDVLREQIVLRACKAAVKANHHLSLMELEALCSALAGLEDPFHCPHGRPIFIRFTMRELEKGFRRIV
jgi:DNA mismatch repair protein MutL